MSVVPLLNATAVKDAVKLEIILSGPALPRLRLWAREMEGKMSVVITDSIAASAAIACFLDLVDKIEETSMTAQTMLTMANGKSIDLLNVRAEDIDFAVIAEHLGKEKRFNGATPDVEYSVAQHMSIGSDAILAAGGTEAEAAYFHIHDCPEAFWKDDPTPKKVAIATMIEQRCGVMASDVLNVLAEIDDEHEAAIHQAAGLPYPVPEEIKRIVKLYDAIMFVTEWRDLMHDAPHPNWGAYGSLAPLTEIIVPLPWAQARAGWLMRAKRLLPSIRCLENFGHGLRLAHGKTA